MVQINAIKRTTSNTNLTTLARIIHQTLDSDEGEQLDDDTVDTWKTADKLDGIVTAGEDEVTDLQTSSWVMITGMFEMGEQPALSFC